MTAEKNESPEISLFISFIGTIFPETNEIIPMTARGGTALQKRISLRAYYSSIAHLGEGKLQEIKNEINNHIECQGTTVKPERGYSITRADKLADKIRRIPLVKGLVSPENRNLPIRTVHKVGYQCSGDFEIVPTSFDNNAPDFMRKLVYGE